MRTVVPFLNQPRYNNPALLYCKHLLLLLPAEHLQGQQQLFQTEDQHLIHILVSRKRYHCNCIQSCSCSLHCYSNGCERMFKYSNCQCLQHRRSNHCRKCYTQQVTCHGGANGAATVNVNSGTAPLHIPGLRAEVLRFLQTDFQPEYIRLLFMMPTDVSTDNVTITEPSAIAAQSSSTDALCFGSASGGASVIVAGVLPLTRTPGHRQEKCCYSQ